MDASFAKSNPNQGLVLSDCWISWLRDYPDLNVDAASSFLSKLGVTGRRSIRIGIGPKRVLTQFKDWLTYHCDTGSSIFNPNSFLYTQKSLASLAVFIRAPRWQAYITLERHGSKSNKPTAALQLTLPRSS